MRSRSPQRRRPVYRGDLPPPPPPAAPAPAQRPRPRPHSRAPGASPTLDKVREFLAEAGFDSTERPRHDVASRSRSHQKAPEAQPQPQQPRSAKPTSRIQKQNLPTSKRLPDPPPAPPVPTPRGPSRPVQAPAPPPPPPAPPAPPAPVSFRKEPAKGTSRAWADQPLPRNSRSDSRERESRIPYDPPAPPPVPGGRRWYEDSSGSTRHLPEPPPVPESKTPRAPSPRRAPKPDSWDSWHSEYGDGYDARYDYWDVPDRRHYDRYETCSRSSQESEDEGGDQWMDLPPPPQVPQGYSGKGFSKSMPRKKAFNPSRWFCHVCNKDFWNQEKYDSHVADEHIPCPEEGCNFSGPEHVMAVHKLKHVKAADGSSVTDSPEELTAWRAMRKANFPSKGNLQRKIELEEKRRLSGALADPPKVSMLEKLLRSQHGMEKGKGKGKGKKGKFKSKGKDGKDGRGKDYSSYGYTYNFKGDGKSKGKKGKSKGKEKGKGKRMPWSMGMNEELEDNAHPTHSLPLPSVVANCVPLESSFGNSSGQARYQAFDSGRGKLGVCRFFERGFCYHGAACQYEHIGSPPQAQASDITPTAWWVLPSTLANRAGRPGEGPAGGVFGPLRTRQVRATHVEPYRAPEARERRDGLLRRLLQPDVERYYSAILQCVRYIVATDFLQLERPHAPSVPFREDTTPEIPTACADLGREELDDSEISKLGAFLKQS
ncbi:Nufip1 [Symbiodinium sp. CCMP2456]|nr:Nufip1 [Symbiodinium sp. CCMP2456]